MTPLMVIAVLCAAVAEESDLGEQDVSHESEGSPVKTDEFVRQIQAFIQ